MIIHIFPPWGKLENGGNQKKKEMLRIPHPEAHAVDILIQIHPDIFFCLFTCIIYEYTDIFGETYINRMAFIIYAVVTCYKLHKKSLKSTLLKLWSIVTMHAKSLQSSLTLCNPMGHSLPGSSVHGILQARILKWGALPSSRRSSWPRDQTPHLLHLQHWQAGSLPLAPPWKPP